jgi:hypothetical protein
MYFSHYIYLGFGEKYNELNKNSTQIQLLAMLTDKFAIFRADYYFAGLLPGAAPVTRPMCQLAPPVCDPSARYRTIDGSCNNLRNPTWGMTGSLFNRLIPAKYADGTKIVQHSFFILN